MSEIPREEQDRRLLQTSVNLIDYICSQDASPEVVNIGLHGNLSSRMLAEGKSAKVHRVFVRDRNYPGRFMGLQDAYNFGDDTVGDGYEVTYTDLSGAENSGIKHLEVEVPSRGYDTDPFAGLSVIRFAVYNEKHPDDSNFWAEKAVKDANQGQEGYIWDGVDPETVFGTLCLIDSEEVISRQEFDLARSAHAENHLGDKEVATLYLLSLRTEVAAIPTGNSGLARAMKTSVDRISAAKELVNSGDQAAIDFYAAKGREASRRKFEGFLSEGEIPMDDPMDLLMDGLMLPPSVDNDLTLRQILTVDIPEASQ